MLRKKSENEFPKKNNIFVLLNKRQQFKQKTMGKGDRKTKKGKRTIGSYGVSRRRKSSTPVVISKPKKKKKKKKAVVKAKTTKEVDPVKTIAAEKAETKKTTAKKPAAKNTTTKKPAAKKTAASKAKE